MRHRAVTRPAWRDLGEQLGNVGVRCALGESRHSLTKGRPGNPVWSLRSGKGASPTTDVAATSQGCGRRRPRPVP
jgi:hypothetical protein